MGTNLNFLVSIYTVAFCGADMSSVTQAILVFHEQLVTQPNIPGVLRLANIPPGQVHDQPVDAPFRAKQHHGCVATG